MPVTRSCAGGCDGHSTYPVPIAEAAAAGGGSWRLERGLASGMTLTADFEISPAGDVTCSPRHRPWVIDGEVYGLTAR